MIHPLNSRRWDDLLHRVSYLMEKMGKTLDLTNEYLKIKIEKERSKYEG